jgi:hypothetical protein
VVQDARWYAKHPRNAIGDTAISCPAFDLDQESFWLQADDATMRKLLVPLQRPRRAKDKTEKGRSQQLTTMTANQIIETEEPSRASSIFLAILWKPALAQ